MGTPAVHAIMAGGEFALPEDMPSSRLDKAGADSAFNFVGGLEVRTGTGDFLGTATALSRHWALTAGHNVDFDDGIVDAGITVDFHLPGFGSRTASESFTNPDFDGFGNPTVHNDLALLRFDDPLPELAFPELGRSLETGDAITLAGFGRSGFGSYGYTTDASLTERRTGRNVVDSFERETGGDGLLFRYDFDAPDTTGEPGGSLGNQIETLIGPGDSGGPALLWEDGGLALAGLNTFTEGFGGRFGDFGGGVVLDPHWDWISETTGLAIVPEPAQFGLFLGCASLGGLFVVRRRKGATGWEMEKGGCFSDWP